MLDSNSYSVIGIYLTLAGLLGTFFYVHLSNWLQELLKLQAKWRQNKRGTDDSQQAAKRECRFEIKEHFNHVPFVVACVVSLFICLLWADSSKMLAPATSDTLVSGLKRMLDVFMVLYFALTTYLLGHGFLIGWRITRELDASK